ncbi:uncharacterized protein LOC135950898 [Calliphora vicina]|uniref:uncharacterized protein LOC135950898 n=1 Tax=Calliphora vicina TaxID=7373 RepID=UPI00325AA0A7
MFTVFALYYKGYNFASESCTTNSSALDCHRECNFDSGQGSGISLLKSSRTSARSGKTRYEVTIRLGANLTAFYRHIDGEQRAKEQLPSFLEKHLMRVLRNFNITKISDLELISNTTERLDITFHFFGVKGDSNRIREAITRMVERGKIGNITLVSNYHLFDENPPLNLMDLSVNQKQIIREESEFILSCTAQGSARMQFQWFKDGIVVNASKATREIWTTVLPPETKDVFTAILGISKANRLDEGIYTCKVTDWGVEQCRSLHVHIKSPPRLRVDPASVTLHKGDSLRVRCLSPGNDDIKRYAQLGYSWTRNGNLFQSDPKTVMWEDLYPDGSILKINNIQRSAEYSCVVSNTVKPVSKSVYITVIDRNAVHVCHAETNYGVHWPTSAPGGVAVISDCPRGFEGFSRRTCEKRDVGNSTWLPPDFSNCIRDQLLMIYNKFRALVSGFQQTTTSELLKASLDYTLKRYKHFLPGEAGFLIDMLHELDNYLQLKGTQLEREMAAEIILHILDKVMQNTQSLNSQQQIKKLQLLTQSAALNRETIAASQLATSTSTGSITQAQASSSSSSSSSAGSSSGTLQHSTSSSSSASASHITTLTQSSIDDRPAPATHMNLNGGATSGSSANTASSSSSAATSGNNQQHQQQTLLKTTDILLTTPNRAGMVGADSSSSGSSHDGSHSVLTVDEDSLSLDRLNSLRIYMTSIKTLPFNLRIYGDDLFSDQLYMDIGLSNRLLNIMANNTIFASVISYKNLKSFLPKTYYTRGSDPKESDYILASRIIQTWLFQSNRSNDNMREPLDLPFEHGHVEIIFQHERAPKDSDWIAVCGHDYKASFESSWRSDLCITKNLMENITRCICPVSGTYVVMLTKRNNHSHHLSTPPRPIFVIISCVCCLLQSCSAFIILLPIWYNRQCAITFLKMQFCVSTSSIMVIFLLGFLKMLPVNWQPIISSSLASLLLLGISTLIAIALVIHSELVPKKLLHVNNKSTNATNSTTVSTAAATTNINTVVPGSATDGGGGGGATLTVTTGTLTTAQEQELENTTILQTNREPVGEQALRQSVATSLKPPLRFVQQGTSAAGVRGAIGISWLLPLLFAITSPLICTINGKWPQNWWLEIMSHSMATATTSQTGNGGTGLMGTTAFAMNTATNSFLPLNERYIRTHLTPFTTEPPLLSNGDSFLEFNTTTALDNTNTNAHLTTTSSSSSSSSSTIDATSTIWSHSLQTAAHSPVTSISFLHNEDTTSANAAANLADGGGAGGLLPPAVPALNFILFLFVDILFILLFFALFAILIKKLLWLWHKNRPLDKFNMVMKQRIGLLYRTGCLLLIKLCTDALFIVYSNSMVMETTWWCYPFGISCILMGFTILFCFIIKPECSLRGSRGSSNHFSGMGDNMKKKLSSSKTSLDDNYCTGSINAPINFYTNHEKESESCAAAPPLMHKTPPSPARQHLEMSAASCQMPGLTIISTAPRCQMMPLLAAAGTATQQEHVASVETFIGTAGGGGGNNSTLERKASTHLACMQQQQHQHINLQTSAASSPATRCCNILGGVGVSLGAGAAGSNMSQQPQHQLTGMPQVVSGSSVGYYDAYVASAAATLGMQATSTPSSLNMTGSLSRRTHLTSAHHQHQHQQQQPALTHEFVGVETLDILQGVAPDTLIGIRSSVNPVSICSSMSSYHPTSGVHYTNAAPGSYLNTVPPSQTQLIPAGAIVSISSLTNTAAPTGTINYTIPATIITTTSVTTQTPKTQKRVTIMEPTTNHTFDPLLPTMVALAGANTSSNVQQQQQQHPTPIITITTNNSQTPEEKANKNKESSEDEEDPRGMLDRITHDLNYLLNGAEDDQIPPPPRPPTGSIPSTELANAEVIFKTDEL